MDDLDKQISLNRIDLSLEELQRDMEKIREELRILKNAK